MKARFGMFLDDDVANKLSAYDVTLTWRHPGEAE